MNKTYFGRSPVTAEQLLDIETAQAEETVPSELELLDKLYIIKFILFIVSPTVSIYLPELISFILQIDSPDGGDAMLYVFVYALVAFSSLTYIYRNAKVNPLRSIHVRALEVSYYVSLLLMPYLSVLEFFPHGKYVVVSSVCYGIAMLIPAVIFIFNGCGLCYGDVESNDGSVPFI